MKTLFIIIAVILGIITLPLFTVLALIERFIIYPLFNIKTSEQTKFYTDIVLIPFEKVVNKIQDL